MGYSRSALKGTGSDVEWQLREAHVQRVITREPKSSRDQLKKALDTLSAGDVLVVVASDDLSPSVEHFARTINKLNERGILFHSLTEPALCTDGDAVPQGEIYKALEALRRRLISDRTKGGMHRAAEEGRLPGRPKVMTAEKIAIALELRRVNRSYKQIGLALEVSESAVRRALESPDS